MTNKNKVFKYTAGAVLAGSLVVGGLTGCGSKDKEEDKEIIGKDNNEQVEVEEELDLDEEETDEEVDEEELDEKEDKKDTKNKKEDKSDKVSVENKGNGSNESNEPVKHIHVGSNETKANAGVNKGNAVGTKRVSGSTVSKGTKTNTGKNVSKVSNVSKGKGTSNASKTNKPSKSSKPSKVDKQKEKEKQLKAELRGLKKQENALKKDFYKYYNQVDKLQAFNNNTTQKNDVDKQYDNVSFLIRGLSSNVGVSTQITLWNTFLPMLEKEIASLEADLVRLQNEEVVRDKVETKSVAYKVDTIKTDDYLKGYKKVDQKGKKGTKEVVYKDTIYKNMKVFKLGNKVETMVKDPVTEKVTVGTRVDYREDLVPVKYDTVKEDDPYLAKGKTEVTQKGVNGEETVKYEITYKNEKEVDRTLTTKPINEHVMVGTMVEVVEKEDYVDFETEKVEDPTLMEGKTEVVQKGTDGYTAVTYEVGTKNGKQVRKDKVEGSEKVVKPTKEIVKVGTMKEDRKTEEIDYRKVTVENPYLEKGKTNVLQEGKKGSKTEIRHIGYKDGKEVHNKYVGTEVEPAVNEITEIGTMDVKVETETVKYKTIKKDEPTLEAGETKVSQKGKNGKKEITTKTGTRNGEVVYNTTSSKMLEDVVDEIILVGTMVEETREEVINYETKYEEDSSLAKGEEKVVQEGKNGKKVYTDKVGYENGNRIVVKEDKKGEVTEKAVTKIVKVGQLETKEETKTNTLKYNTIKKNDPTLDKGKTKVSQKGKNGKEEIVYEVKYVKGKEVERNEINRNVTDPVDEIILVGTKVTEVKTETKSVDVPFKQETIKDDTMALGQTKVVTKGQNGTKEVSYEVTYVNGKEEKRVETGSKVTKKPVNEVVKVGTVDVEAERQEALRLINEYRVANGRQPLKVDSRAMNYAQNWSKTMTEIGMVHSDANNDFRRKYADVGTVAENIHSGSLNAESPFNGWKESPAHNAEMLNSRYTHYGIGFSITERGRSMWSLIMYEQVPQTKTTSISTTSIDEEETNQEVKKEVKKEEQPKEEKPVKQPKEEPKQEEQPKEEVQENKEEVEVQKEEAVQQQASEEVDEE